MTEMHAKAMDNPIRVWCRRKGFEERSCVDNLAIAGWILSLWCRLGALSVCMLYSLSTWSLAIPFTMIIVKNFSVIILITKIRKLLIFQWNFWEIDSLILTPPQECYRYPVGYWLKVHWQWKGLQEWVDWFFSNDREILLNRVVIRGIVRTSR